MLIRAEETDDRQLVYTVNVAAFDTPAEARLVDTLRAQARPMISLVAEDNGTVVGQIMFSPVSLSGHPEVKLMGLAPMAVRPDLQRQGIGTALVRAGLLRCRKLGYVAVIMLGHAAYYPRFGFLPAVRFGIDSEYDVPEEVFMALELEPEALKGKSGRVRYHDAFSAP